MATTVKTICKDGLGDYTTLQSWEDAAPANLVTDGNIWQGQIMHAADVFSGSATMLTISGSTSDATHYKELTTATGASFRDNASAQTNALAYDSTKGCAITAAFYSGNAIVFQENYARLKNLQIEVAGTSVYGSNAVYGGDYHGQYIDNCIISTKPGAGTGNTTLYYFGSNTIRNSILINNISGATSYICLIRAGASAVNCTIVAPTGLAVKPTYAVYCDYQVSTFENCAIFGATALYTGGTTPTFTTCVSDLTGTGITQITYDNSAFADTTANWKPVAGSRLLNVGTTDATNAATDIVGTARPQPPTTGSYDVGCWELKPPPVRVMRLFAGFKIQFKSGVLRIR